MLEPEVRIFADAASLYVAAADEVARICSSAVQATGRCTVALGGGATPKGMFAELVRSHRNDTPWSEVLFFWGDERHVPPEHPDSNYGMAREHLLSRIPVRSENIFRICAEHSDAEVVARDYEQTLRRVFKLPEGVPRFDLMLLGLGADGHTASLFPETAALHETKRLVVANWVPKFRAQRITVTLPILNHAAQVVFLVSGREKLLAVRSALSRSRHARELPARMVQPTDGGLLWFLDRDAAGSDGGQSDSA
jgi:6-phosphogluconolactonase